MLEVSTGTSLEQLLLPVVAQSEEVQELPARVPVREFVTLAKKDIDRERLASNTEYLVRCFSDFGPPIIEDKIMIAPNAGPYSDHLHLLLFYTGRNCNSENLPPRGLTDIPNDELGAVGSKIMKTVKTITNVTGQSQVVILINSGDLEGGVRSQSISRVHFHAFVPSEINESDFRNLEDLKSHPDFAYIVDSVGISPRIKALNDLLELRIQDCDIPVRDRSRYVEFGINAGTDVIHQMYEIFYKCEEVRLALKRSQIYYGFTVMVQYENCLPQFGRVGFFRDYGELIFNQLIFRAHSDDASKNNQLRRRIARKFEEFKEAYYKIT